MWQREGWEAGEKNREGILPAPRLRQERKAERKRQPRQIQQE